MLVKFEETKGVLLFCWCRHSYKYTKCDVLRHQ